jgi:hypothetical protein
VTKAGVPRMGRTSDDADLDSSVRERTSSSRLVSLSLRRCRQHMRLTNTWRLLFI